mgnify:CR=1 FL=1
MDNLERIIQVRTGTPFGLFADTGEGDGEQQPELPLDKPIQPGELPFDEEDRAGYSSSRREGFSGTYISPGGGAGISSSRYN